MSIKGFSNFISNHIFDIVQTIRYYVQLKMYESVLDRSQYSTLNLYVGYNLYYSSNVLDIRSLQ